MAFNKSLWSSKTPEWATPQDLFDKLNEKYNFNLDPCATKENAKCERFFTVEDDGLKQSWAGYRVFMNPPYSRGLFTWIEKAYNESLNDHTVVVCLLPARTDTKWFHDLCTKGKIEFLRGRLKFGGATNSAPFPSMIVTFGNSYVQS